MLDIQENDNTLRKHIAITMRYFATPTRILELMIDKIINAKESTRDKYIKCLILWVEHGNMCYEDNVTIAKVVRYILQAQLLKMKDKQLELLKTDLELKVQNSPVVITNVSKVIKKPFVIQHPTNSKGSRTYYPHEYNWT
jgi:hypothetical protein